MNLRLNFNQTHQFPLSTSITMQSKQDSNQVISKTIISIIFQLF